MLELLYHNSVLLLKCTVYGWAWTQLEEQSPDQYGGIWRIATQTTRHQRNMVWFWKSAIETSMSSSSPVSVTSFNFEAKSQEPHTLWEVVFTVLQIHPQTPNAQHSPKNWCWAKHWMVNLNFCASGNWIRMMWMINLTLQMKIHLRT